MSRPWSHPVVLNTGPLDWESSALTTKQFNKAPTFLITETLDIFEYLGGESHRQMKIKKS